MMVGQDLFEDKDDIFRVTATDKLLIALQGRRNASIEQNNQLKNVLVEFAFTSCLPVSCWVASMALEDLFREEEASVILLAHNFCLLSL